MGQVCTSVTPVKRLGQVESHIRFQELETKDPCSPSDYQWEIVIPWDGKGKEAIFDKNQNFVPPHFLSTYPVERKCDFCQENTRNRLARQTFPSMCGYYACTTCIEAGKPSVNYDLWHQIQGFDQMLKTYANAVIKVYSNHKSYVINPVIQAGSFWVDRKGVVCVGIYEQGDSELPRVQMTFEEFYQLNI